MLVPSITLMATNSLLFGAFKSIVTPFTSAYPTEISITCLTLVEVVVENVPPVRITLLALKLKPTFWNVAPVAIISVLLSLIINMSNGIALKFPLKLKSTPVTICIPVCQSK